MPSLDLRRRLRSGSLWTFRGLSIVAFVVLAGTLVAISATASAPLAIALATFVLFFMFRAIFPTDALDAFARSLVTGEAGERVFVWLEAKLRTLRGWFPW